MDPCIALDFPLIQGQLRDSSVPVAESQTCDKKVAGSSPGRSGKKILFSRFMFQYWFLYMVSTPPPVLPQQHIKDLGNHIMSQTKWRWLSDEQEKMQEAHALGLATLNKPYKNWPFLSIDPEGAVGNLGRLLRRGKTITTFMTHNWAVIKSKLTHTGTHN